LFGKPETRPYRRMAVTLARAKNVDTARKNARQAAGRIEIVYS
jgi:phosphoribosylglycinamide formyltransferase 2